MFKGINPLELSIFNHEKCSGVSCVCFVAVALKSMMSPSILLHHMSDLQNVFHSDGDYLLYSCVTQIIQIGSLVKKFENDRSIAIDLFCFFGVRLQRQ